MECIRPLSFDENENENSVSNLQRSCCTISWKFGSNKSLAETFITNMLMMCSVYKNDVAQCFCCRFPNQCKSCCCIVDRCFMIIIYLISPIIIVFCLIVDIIQLLILCCHCDVCCDCCKFNNENENSK